MTKFKHISKTVLLALPYVLLAVSLLIPDSLSILSGLRLRITNDMAEQNKLSSQEPSGFFSDSMSIIPSPPNSIPRVHAKYRFTQVEYDSAIVRFTNPLPRDKYVLARGKNRYEIFCVPCHNHDGMGEGLIVTKPELAPNEEGMPPPTDLTGSNARNIPDGRLFHILSAGQNLMFPVNFKMNETDRWAVVHYIRFLQESYKE